MEHQTYIRTKNGKPFSVGIEEAALGNDGCAKAFQDVSDACDEFFRRRKMWVSAGGFRNFQFGAGNRKRNES